MGRRYPWITHGSALALLLALYVILALAYNAADPLFEPPDEILHYDFVRYLQRERALPVIRLDDPPSEYHQPPLYYTLAAVLAAWFPAEDYSTQVQRNPFWAYNIGAVGRDNKNQFLHGPAQAFPYQQTSLAVHLIRLLSTLGGVATVYWTYRFALSLLPGNHPLALATAALVAFTPNFLLTTAAVTNDAFASTAPVGLMLYMFHMLEQPSAASPRQWAGLSVLLSLAMLIKANNLPLLLIAAALAGILARRHRSWRAFITAGLILGAGVGLLTGWWFARNLVLYGDLTGLNQMWKVWGTRPPLTWADYKVETWNFLTTYWANFGYGNIPAPNLVYRVIDGLTTLGALGLFWRVLNRLRHNAVPPGLPNDKLILVSLWIVLTAAALLWYLQRTLQVTGRQIYAIIPALSFCLIWGWARLVPRRWHVHLALISSGSIFALGLTLLPGILIPAYRPAPRLPANQIGQTGLHRLDWRLGDVTTLLGYSLSPEAVNPGKEIIVTLYWRPLRTPDLNYMVFVHLLGEDNAVVGARETYPGLGNDPTINWSPGEIIVDAIPVPIAPNVTGPTLLDVEAGLYNLETGERLTITDSAGHPIQFPRLGAVKLSGNGTAQGAPTYPLNVTFEGGLTLKGYSLSATETRPGDALTLALDWAPAGPLAGDYSVFVHLVDEAGKIMAQGDGPPRAGRYPTTAWGPGEYFDDAHVLVLPRDLAAGDYDLRVGLYDPRDNTRLPVVGDGDQVRLDQPITVR